MTAHTLETPGSGIATHAALLPTGTDGPGAPIPAGPPHWRPVLVRPTPDREPPARAAEPGARQGQGRLSLVAGDPRSTRTPLRPLPKRAHAFAPRPTSTADLPEPRGWAAQLALTCAQVAAGIRQPGQVSRFLSPGVQESLSRRRAGAARAGAAVRPLRARAVVISEPADGIVDAVVVTDDGRRARPIALRMVGLDGRWIVTEMVMG